MNLTPKEQDLLQSMLAQEQVCPEKYEKYSNSACDVQLQNLFSGIGQAERQHIDTINQLLSGTIPQAGNGGSALPTPSNPSSCAAGDRQKDQFLCSDSLAMEKHVSSEYNSGIFAFADTGVRSVLNHIQKEEQEHGEKLSAYMRLNGMSC